MRQPGAFEGGESLDMRRKIWLSAVSRGLDDVLLGVSMVYENRGYNKLPSDEELGSVVFLP